MRHKKQNKTISDYDTINLLLVRVNNNEILLVRLMNSMGSLGLLVMRKKQKKQFSDIKNHWISYCESK